MGKAAKAKQGATQRDFQRRARITNDAHRRDSRRTPRRTSRSRRRQSNLVKALVIAGFAVASLAAMFFLNSVDDSSAGDRAAFPYQIGDPGPGAPAPPIRLASTDGTMFDLASMRGETVLFFFQEGLICQPCWDQISDIEARWDEFRALGIDRMISITTDPLDLLRQKVEDERLATPILSDPDLTVSRTYTTNLYGMMGTGMNGHSFIVVDESGLIRWRADYGGAPKYTMYVPINRLLTDLREGLTEQEGPDADIQ